MTSKPPEPLTFFLDESLDSGSIVTALREAGATVERLTDHFPKGTPDAKWLAEAGRRHWIVITRDKRIRYRQLERLALHEAGVRGVRVHRRECHDQGHRRYRLCLAAQYPCGSSAFFATRLIGACATD